MIKIAFCTDDSQTVNVHFGQCDTFAVYAIDNDQVKELPLRNINNSNLIQAPVGAPSDFSKIETRVNAVLDCTLVYLTQIGPSAAARLTQRRVMPIKVAEGTSIQSEIEKLQKVLQGTPPMWLAKALAQPK